MIADEVVASQVKASLIEAFRILDDSAAIVRKKCSEAEVTDYLGRIGPILYEITDKLMDPLYRQHSNLKPDNWL